MKRFIVFLTMIMIVGLLVAPSPGAAWFIVNCGQVSFSLTPSSGPPGTSVTVSGSGAMEDSPFSLYGYGGSILLYSGTTDGSGGFSATVTIPEWAEEGDDFDVAFFGTDENEDSIKCPQDFTVTAATGGVQQDAYTAVTTLPSTGAFLLPVAGLLAAGAGLLIRRRRG